MLRSLKDIEGYRLRALDGDLGKTKDFYFDDASWTVRYAVVDTGKWLPGRRVLISPASFREPDWNESSIPVSLTKDQVLEAPSIEEDRPVSRQHETMLTKHFAWPMYWVAPQAGAPPIREALPPQSVTETQKRALEAGEDPHLRSLNEVVGYGVEAVDGEVGSVDDLIIETDGWSVRYVVADTRKWLPGGRVLLSPEWTDEVRWAQRSIHVDLREAMIKACPPYDPKHAVNREYEERIYDYYGRPRYWA